MKIERYLQIVIIELEERKENYFVYKFYQSISTPEAVYFANEVLFCGVPERYFIKLPKERDKKRRINTAYFYAKLRLLSKTY